MPADLNLEDLPRQQVLDACWPDLGLRPDAGVLTVPCPLADRGCEHAHGDRREHGGTPSAWVCTSTGAWGCKRSGRASADSKDGKGGGGWKGLADAVAPGLWGQLMSQASARRPAGKRGGRKGARPAPTPEEFARWWAALEPETVLTERYAISQPLRERYLRAGRRYPGDVRCDTVYGLWDDAGALRGAKFRLPPGETWRVGAQKGGAEKLLMWTGSKPRDVLFRGRELQEEHPLEAVVVLCAGEKDCLVAASHLDPARWAPVSGCVGEAYVVRLLLPLARRRRVVIAYDADPAGREGSEKNARALARAGAEVLLATIPAEVVAGGGKDVADVWMHGGDAGLVAMLEAATPWAGGAGGEVAGGGEDDGPPDVDGEAGDGAATLPEIVVTAKIKDMADRAEELLAAAELDAYHRGGALVRVARTDPERPTIVAYPEPTLVADLSTIAEWVVETKQGARPVPPPPLVVRALLARTEWRHVLPLDRVTHGPLLRPDGTVMLEPGYDRAARLLYAPAYHVPAVPEHPTKAQARAALDALVDVVDEFPWVAASDRASWLALVLTLVARPALTTGALPLFLVRASAPSSGKSLLIDLAAVIGTDRLAPARMTQVTDDLEEQKTLLALGDEGEPLVLIDNVRRPLGSAQLEAVLTSPGGRFKGRVLGQTRMLEVCVPLLLATGNNVQLAGDMWRRVLPIDIDPRCERPDERTGWRYPRVLEHVVAHRGALRAAALTVLRWYCAEGRPPAPVDMRAWGGYEGWSGLVRQALVWLGEADPCEGRDRVILDGDPEGDSRRSVLDLWWSTWGDAHMTALQVAQGAGEELRIALVGAGAKVRGAAADLDPRSLGYALRLMRGRICGGLVLERAGEAGRGGVTKWRVRQLGGAAAVAEPGWVSGEGEPGDGAWEAGRE